MAKKLSKRQKIYRAIKKWLKSDIVARASKTFVQAFVATLLITDAPLSKTALVGAGAAAFSATWNSLKEL